MQLKTFQEEFQSFILTSDKKIIEAILPSATLTSAEKISIYQNGYLERIIHAPQQDFPVLCALLGESAFSGLVCDYIDAYPSHDYSLQCLGKRLSEFIVEKEVVLQPFSDLARFEYLLCEMEQRSDLESFHSDFNVVEIWRVFHEENRLIEFQYRNANEH